MKFKMKLKMIRKMTMMKLLSKKILAPNTMQVKRTREERLVGLSLKVLFTWAISGWVPD